MVGISEIALSILLLMPLSESQEAIKQHLQTQRTEIYTYSNLISVGNTYKTNKELEQKRIKEEEIKQIKLKEQERLKKEAEKKKQNTKDNKKVDKANRGGSVDEDIFILTFYTNLPSENGGYTTNAYSQKLKRGMVASNHYKKGTRIKLQGYGTVKVLDRGGEDFDRSNRLDVFVPRKGGESDGEYLKRVNNMGRVKVKGKIL